MNVNELVLECRVRGEPRPSIAWTKDGNFIDNDDKYLQIDQADGLCRLVVSNPSEKDSGVYICKADNSVASDQVSHNVTFEGQNAYISEKTHGYFHRDPNKPQFQNALGDHLVTAGGTIALQAEIIHGPVEVQWLCEKEPIVYSDKVRSIYDHGVYTLILTEATKELSGTYTCRATNAFGKVESNAHVHVVGPSVKGGKCPLFLSRPDAEMKIMTGDPFSFSFRLIGDPKPKCMFLSHTLPGSPNIHSKYFDFHFRSDSHERLTRYHTERSYIEGSARRFHSFQHSTVTANRFGHLLHCSQKSTWHRSNICHHHGKITQAEEIDWDAANTRLWPASFLDIFFSQFLYHLSNINQKIF